jgi:hypothetical protein
MGWDINGPSVDLQDAFSENALSLTRNNVDDRRKATMMMYGDKYDYFWVDKGGFDYTEFAVNSMEYQSAVGANEVKHLVGNDNDHVIGTGTTWLVWQRVLVHICFDLQMYI